ncbi:MAG: radical SAM-associated putative lipoprotein [Bacteroidales bacterium]|nr:radical SAM-associated putative lipoprotein [Bacteroidales bacterium]
MKKKVYKVMNLLLGSVVTMLGFESCGDDSPFGGGDVVEYGVPHATYRVVGTVTDQNGKPIEGIKVKMIVDTPYEVIEHGATQTDIKGKYTTGEWEYANEFLSDNVKVVFNDEDGDANGGKFASDTLLMKDLNKTKYANAPKHDHWSSGSFEFSADIKLKKQDND